MAVAGETSEIDLVLMLKKCFLEQYAEGSENQGDDPYLCERAWEDCLARIYDTPYTRAPLYTDHATDLPLSIKHIEQLFHERKAEKIRNRKKDFNTTATFDENPGESGLRESTMLGNAPVSVEHLSAIENFTSPKYGSSGKKSVQVNNSHHDSRITATDLSGDNLNKSRDNANESRDNSNESRDNANESRDNSNESRDNSNESRDNLNESGDNPNKKDDCVSEENKSCDCIMDNTFAEKVPVGRGRGILKFIQNESKSPGKDRNGATDCSLPGAKLPPHESDARCNTPHDSGATCNTPHDSGAICNKQYLTTLTDSNYRNPYFRVRHDNSASYDSSSCSDDIQTGSCPPGDNSGRRPDAQLDDSSTDEVLSVTEDYSSKCGRTVLDNLTDIQQESCSDNDQTVRRVYVSPRYNRDGQDSTSETDMSTTGRTSDDGHDIAPAGVKGHTSVKQTTGRGSRFLLAAMQAAGNDGWMKSNLKDVT